jgi:hypothetical protein
MFEHTGYIGKPTVKSDRYLHFLFSALDTKKNKRMFNEEVHAVWGKKGHRSIEVPILGSICML